MPILVTPPPGVWERRLYFQTRQLRIRVLLVSCSHYIAPVSPSTRDTMATTSVHNAALNSLCCRF